jgi:predicted esterase
VSLVHDDIQKGAGSGSLSFSHPGGTKQQPPSILNFNLPFNERPLSEPHKVTHLHPSGIVSYSILRPPSPNAVGTSSTSKLPILLQLHGAGVEASWDEVSQSLNCMPDLRAWVLFPSGVTPLSADDWHAWGFADVQAAIDNIPSWIKRHEFELVDIDTNSWIVSGHSNGGQGAWYALTHHPDRVLGAAPVSGYLSIQQYVPYTYWHPIDSKKRAVIESATNSYHLDLLASNAKGIDVEQQHGSQDDNVPPYQSRLMAQLLAEANGNSHFVELSTPGEQSSHWYDGIMTTENLRYFYERMCEKYQQRGASVLRSGKTGLTDDIFFTLVVGNPADQGPKGGFKVTQLQDPGQLGKLHVHFNSRTKAWDVRSTNILCFEIPLAAELPYQFDSLNIHEATIDGQKLNFIQSERRNLTVWQDLQEWKIEVPLL